ncbi:MAG: hypothetical protein R2746_04925 [Acidimicrobiales bacterium]
MRARGDLREVRAADLRFTAAEAAAYLNDAMDLALTAADVEVLEARTEGWIAALQLAALSLQGRADPAAFVAEFAGDDRFILDYLADEVLERQPPSCGTSCSTRRSSARSRPTSAPPSPASPTPGPPSIGSTGRTCSSCRSTTGAPGTGTTTSSPTSCGLGSVPTTPTGWRASTAAPASGTPPTATATRRWSTPWRAATRGRPS